MATNANPSEASINDVFLNWFKSSGGNVHSAVGLTTFPLMGRGAVALQDIPKETVLFTLPRSLTLSTRTSSLPSRFGAHEWKKYQLHKGWVGLILCMLWEDTAGKDGKWSSYLSSLPNSFQTPMFWNDDDLQELEGTTISDKIGKTEAEEDYQNKLLPAIKSRPDLFLPQALESHYSLHKYHVMGSRILSRSFHVEKWTGDDHEDSAENQSPAHGAHSSDAMDVDAAEPKLDEEGQDEPGNEEEENESDNEDEEDPSDVAMVPLADILNARYQSENAKLCYESEDLEMISTRDIQAGEQIWNTYGDPPNSDLLRRYGHVDCIPMPGRLEGNPADIVEIRADLVVEVLRESNEEDALVERIEWWLEEGGDDIFTLETTSTLPEGLMSLIRLLTMPSSEWAKARDKGKVPKPKTDPDAMRVAGTVLEKRLAMFKTSIEEDEALLSTPDSLSDNKRMAVVVRLGEKRILKRALEAVEMKDSPAVEGENGKRKRKEHGDGDEAGSSKRKRR